VAGACDISLPGGALAVTLRGELDAHDAPELRRTIADALEARPAGERVVLDLTGVSFLDSTILGMLVGVVRRGRDAGGEVRVVLPETAARRIFEITGVDSALDVYPSRRSALSA
jgi:anti-anti-sigma factor